MLQRNIILNLVRIQTLKQNIKHLDISVTNTKGKSPLSVNEAKILNCK